MFGVRIFKFVFNVLFDFLLPTSHFSLDTELPYPEPLSNKSLESLPNDRLTECDPIKDGLVGQCKNMKILLTLLIFIKTASFSICIYMENNVRRTFQMFRSIGEMIIVHVRIEF